MSARVRSLLLFFVLIFLFFPSDIWEHHGILAAPPAEESDAVSTRPDGQSGAVPILNVAPGFSPASAALSLRSGQALKGGGTERVARTSDVEVRGSKTRSSDPPNVRTANLITASPRYLLRSQNGNAAADANPFGGRRSSPKGKQDRRQALCIEARNRLCRRWVVRPCGCRPR